MTTVTVSNTAGLNQAMASAQSGDTILLTAGVYTEVGFSGLNYSGNVTIASADPDHRATLYNLFVANSSGLTFENLEFNSDVASIGAKSADTYPFQLNGSDRITLRGNDFHGSLDGNPSNDRTTLLINDSTNVTVTGNEFHEAEYAIVHSDSSYLNISNNNFHDIRIDGIHGSSSYVTAIGNFFTNFHSLSGDHSDAIQFFNEGDSIFPHDLTLIGNVYLRGSGTASEGIFIGSDVRTSNIDIEDNLMGGTQYHGVTVGNVDGLIVKNNVIDSYADYPSFIWISDANNVIETGNSAQSFIYGYAPTSRVATNSNTAITVANNTELGMLTDETAFLNSWLASHPSFYANQIDLSEGSTTPPASLPDPPPVVQQPDPPATPPVVVTTVAPAGLSLDTSTDTGIKGDGVTRTALVRIDGTVADAGAKVTLFGDGSVIGSGLADSTGKFSILASTALAAGDHGIQAVATSAAGVASAASAAMTLTIDTVGPSADLLDFSLTRGTSRNAWTVGLSGDASDEHGVSAVSLYRDGALIKTGTASDSGAWSLQDTGAGTRSHTYTVTTTDGAGNIKNADHALIMGTASGETLKGTAGADIVWGGGGYDTLTGGGGSDIFVFSSTADAPVAQSSRGKITNIETITDFAAGDRIDFSDLGHLTFDGKATTVHANAVTWYTSGGNTFIVVDTDGDRRADVNLQLSGVHALTASDFLLG